MQDLDVDGKVNLKWIFKMWDEGMGWIDLAQDRVRFQENGVNFLTI